MIHSLIDRRPKALGEGISQLHHLALPKGIKGKVELEKGVNRLYQLQYLDLFHQPQKYERQSQLR